MLLILRLRRAGAVLGVGVTSLLTGACVSLVIWATVFGTLYRFLIAVLVLVLLRATVAFYRRSRFLRQLIESEEELSHNKDLGTRPPLHTPPGAEEKAKRKWFERVFPNLD